MNASIFRSEQIIGSLRAASGRATLFVALACLAGLAFNALRPDSLPLFQDWRALEAEQAAVRLATGLVALDTDRVARLYTEKHVLVLDARARDFYLMEHIPGALSMPLDEADARLGELLRALPPDTLVITYCDSVTCEMGQELGRKVLAAGHARVGVYLEGMADWLRRGMPVESAG
ncbi:MAG: rhodanese-like domain-containing protein [Proteobacteria bacterium]|nr:rhodanese-like domain-containing protein [Pseudomonadota bacterium]